MEDITCLCKNPIRVLNMGMTSRFLWEAVHSCSCGEVGSRRIEWEIRFGGYC